MKKEYIIPAIEVLKYQTQPLLTSSIVLKEDIVEDGLSRDLDLFEIGDNYEGGF